MNRMLDLEKIGQTRSLSSFFHIEISLNTDVTYKIKYPDTFDINFNRSDIEIVNSKNFQYTKVIGNCSPKIETCKNKTFILFPALNNTIPKIKNNRDAVDACRDFLIDAFIIIDSKTLEVTWAESKWSRVNLCFMRNDRGIEFSTSADVFLSSLKKNELYFKSIEALSWAPTELDPYENVSLSIPETVYTLKSFNLLESRNVEPHSLNEEVTTKGLYQSLKETYVNLQEDRRFLNLTGGCDTRLLLSMLDNHKDYVYWLNITDLDNSDKTKRDLYIFENLMKVNGLTGLLVKFHENQEEVSYRCIGENDFSQGLPSSIEPLVTKRSSFRYSPTGHYGGEFLGGEVFNVFPVFKKILGIEINCPEELKIIESQYAFMKNNKSYFSRYLSSCRQTVFANALKLFYKSFRSRIYGGVPPWKTPNKYCKVYGERTFLTPKFLEMLSMFEPSRVFDYQLYKDVYKENAKKWIKVPFNSSFMTDDDFKNLLKVPIEELDQSFDLEHFKIDLS